MHFLFVQHFLSIKSCIKGSFILISIHLKYVVEQKNSRVMVARGRLCLSVRRERCELCRMGGERGKVAQCGEPKGDFSMLNINNSWRHSPHPTHVLTLHYIHMSAAARPLPAYLLCYSSLDSKRNTIDQF
jgi:hypothetical protein